MFLLASCVLGSELPAHSFLTFVSVLLPVLEFDIEILQLINPLLAKALLRQRGQLYLCDVKSAAMLGCMMELKTFGKSQCLSRWKRFVE